MNEIAQQVLEILTASKKMMVCAESCTGGLISSAITDIAGSSAVFDRGFITYSNNAKVDILGVREETLETFGAVSEQVACEMARGALENSMADFSISVTGIAGPTGGTKEKPVGFVCFGYADKDKTVSTSKNFSGTRQEVRYQSSVFALEYLLSNIKEASERNA